MAHFINKYLTQAAYDADSTKQYPNASLVNGSMVYVPTQPVVDVPDVVAEITVSSDDDYILSNGSYDNLSADNFEYVKVDGVAIDFDEYAENGYTWPLTAGNHTITYKHATGGDSNLSFFQGEHYSDDSLGQYTLNSLTVNSYYYFYRYSSDYWAQGINATNIDLWDGFYSITRYENQVDENTEMLAPFTCTNLTLRSNTLVHLGYVECDCSCMGLEEDGEGCYQCNKFDENDECIDKEYIEPINFYDVPSISGVLYVPQDLIDGTGVTYPNSEWTEAVSSIDAID